MIFNDFILELIKEQNDLDFMLHEIKVVEERYVLQFYKNGCDRNPVEEIKELTISEDTPLRIVKYKLETYYK